MTDRIRHLTVVLADDYRDDDVEAIVQSIRMIRGGAAVEAHVVTTQDQLSRAAVHVEIERDLHAAIAEGPAVSAIHTVEFKLSMPGRASWNGGWSGADKNYVVVRELPDEVLARLFDSAPAGSDLARCRRSWTHAWPDGWIAQVSARVVPVDEERAKSDGFAGYDWMIDNILRTGSPYPEEQRS